jgi:hypothetical protein
MLGATAVAIFFVPMFFLVLEKLGIGKSGATPDTGTGPQSGLTQSSAGKGADE